MQETLTFPTMGSPHHRFTFSQACYTEYSERCSPVSTPFVSAPSSPGRHGHGDLYFSAPTSPYWAHTSDFMASEDTVLGYPSAIPFCWEDKPWTLWRSSENKSKGNGKDEAGSFAMNSDFEFSARFAELDDPSLSPTPMSSANELFCNGQIKPLKLPPRLEQQPCFANHIIINEHALAAQTRAFEFNNRGPTTVVGSNSSLSAPQSPRFSSTLGCITGDSSACGISELNRGRSAACSNSLSAPQSPCSPLNRVKKALCGVSSRIEKAFDPSLGMAIEGSREPSEGSRDPKEGSKSSMASITHSIQATGHRRTRSFSPLRIFHREEPSTKSFEQEEGVLWRDSSVTDKKQEESSSAQKIFKKWTLKDLLHRKSGGESRSNNSRASSRRSSASMDSTSPREKQSARSNTGRSSSDSSHTSFSSDPILKDSIAIGGYRTRTHMGDNIINNNNANTVNGKGKIPLGDSTNSSSSSSSSSNNNNNNNDDDDGKAKTLGQTLGQRGSKAVSPHELHYMMHKAQSEELRKKTFLPYRQGLLSCLGFSSRSYRTVSTISKTLQSVSG